MRIHIGCPLSRQDRNFNRPTILSAYKAHHSPLLLVPHTEPQLIFAAAGRWQASFSDPPTLRQLFGQGTTSWNTNQWNEAPLRCVRIDNSFPGKCPHRRFMVPISSPVEPSSKLKMVWVQTPSQKLIGPPFPHLLFIQPDKKWRKMARKQWQFPTKPALHSLYLHNLVFLRSGTSVFVNPWSFVPKIFAKKKWLFFASSFQYIKLDLPFRFTAQVAAQLWVHSSWVSALLVALPLYAQRPHHQVTRSGNTGALFPKRAGKGKRLKACLTHQTPNENFQSFSVTRILFHHQIEMLKQIVIVVFQYKWAVVEFPTLLSSQILTQV